MFYFSMGNNLRLEFGNSRPIEMFLVSAIEICLMFVVFLSRKNPHSPFSRNRVNNGSLFSIMVR